MAGDPPLVQLVYAILLAAEQRGAARLRIRPASAEHCVVELEIGGQTVVEMEPPAQLLGPIVRRLSIMASLPTYPKGSAAEGAIHLRIGEARDLYFEIHVSGHGDSLTAVLRSKS